MALLPRSVDASAARDRYGVSMKQRQWNVLMWVGIAIAVAGVVGAAVGFSTDTTYPEEVPGWSIAVILVGALVAVGAGVGRGVTKS
jgi:peptidoglycan/LPS O-acetylase OafA/YrhL